VSTADIQEPEIVQDPKSSWMFGLAVALAIVLVFSMAATVNNRSDQPWSWSTGPKGAEMTGATSADQTDLGSETPGRPSTGGELPPTLSPPEGSAPSGRGTVPTPPGPGGNAQPASAVIAAGTLSP